MLLGASQIVAIAAFLVLLGYSGCSVTDLPPPSTPSQSQYSGAAAAFMAHDRFHHDMILGLAVLWWAMRRLRA